MGDIWTSNPCFMRIPRSSNVLPVFCRSIRQKRLLNVQERKRFQSQALDARKLRFGKKRNPSIADENGFRAMANTACHSSKGWP
jgi:hypothetical protein